MVSPGLACCARQQRLIHANFGMLATNSQRRWELIERSTTLRFQLVSATLELAAANTLACFRPLRLSVKPGERGTDGHLQGQLAGRCDDLQTGFSQLLAALPSTIGCSAASDKVALLRVIDLCCILLAWRGRQGLAVSVSAVFGEQLSISDWLRHPAPHLAHRSRRALRPFGNWLVDLLLGFL